LESDGSGAPDYTYAMASQPGIAAPAWSSRLTAELDASDARAQALLSGLSPEQLNWRPRPEAWSLGQCLEHLCITNEQYVPAISASLAGKAESRAQAITPGWFGRWFIKSFIEPSPQTRRAAAPKKIVPGAEVEASVLDRFLRINQATRELIRRAANYDVNRIRFKNPFLPLLRFTVGTGLEIIPGHERRHLLQAERVKEQMANSK
jgi:DinB superfamily